MVTFQREIVVMFSIILPEKEIEYDIKDINTYFRYSSNLN